MMMMMMMVVVVVVRDYQRRTKNLSFVFRFDGLWILTSYLHYWMIFCQLY